jgi:hypothetical protein
MTKEDRNGRIAFILLLCIMIGIFSFGYDAAKQEKAFAEKFRKADKEMAEVLTKLQKEMSRIKMEQKRFPKYNI